MWNSLFFQKTSLHELGLRVQLGHTVGRRCSTAERGHVDFAVIDSNGIHKVNVDFCRCHGLPHRRQLLRIGWWPATPLQPQTCATMEVLKHFHLLNLQGKVPGYSFFRALEFQTDNTGLSASVSSINATHFLLVAHSVSIQGTNTGSSNDTDISQLHAVSLSSLWVLRLC
jgi:hypothetical protein